MIPREVFTETLLGFLEPVRKYLDMARKMARHSLRRAVAR